ncbi:MAG: hypothetical protein WC471_02790 [Candidatus Woesearchaeota archaeon]
MKTIILISILAILILSGCTSTPPVSTDDFAKCLTANGAKMYGAFWCSHCNEQKKNFGESWQYATYIECSNADGTQNDVCAEAGIEGYPTWEFKDGTRKSGTMTFSQLSDMTGCDY